MLVATALVGVCGLCSLSMAQCELSGEQRADLIEIGTMAHFGTLQLPKVVFLHDAHTAAVIAEGKDCSTCHDSANGVMSYKFKRLEDKSAKAVQDIYHENCISCHNDVAAQGKKTGPQDGECRSCHVENLSIESVRSDVAFSKEQHYAHVSAKAIAPAAGAKDNCATCHTMVDGNAAQLVWFKDQADVQTANHTGCISCHQDVVAKNASATTGPVTCAGCHAPAAQAPVSLEEAPRLMNGQADTMLMLPHPAADKPQNLKGTFPPVAFNHKLHEAATATCDACHSPSFMEGANGDQFKPQAPLKAMDLCINCHATQTKKAECAGCHAPMAQVKFENTNCESCHAAVPGYDLEEAQSGIFLQFDQATRSALSAEMLEMRGAPAGTFNLNDIPEVVSIGTIANEYMASEFQHRKIVAAMYKATEGNALAMRFHNEQGTFCQGCHHNSPASLNPPKCSGCHVEKAQDNRPSLKTAFHLQCMGCHESMNVTKPANTDCAGCHKPAN
ncbi:MAG: cytochrome c3 family protein [Pseudomonadota bacterium]